MRINKKTRRGIGARLASRTNIVRLEVGIVVADLEEEAKQVQQLRVVAVLDNCFEYGLVRAWTGKDSGVMWGAPVVAAVELHEAHSKMEQRTRFCKTKIFEML